MFSTNIKIMQRKYTFGYLRVLIAIIASFALLLIYKIIIYKLHHGRSLRLEGLIHVYTLTIETWATFFQLHTAVIETIMWNNTLQMWDNSSLVLFDELTDFTNDYIFANITKSLTYDLGNLTESYRSDILLKGACGYIIFEEEPEKCQVVYDRILNSNLLTVYKEMQYSLRSMIEIWKEARYDWDEVKSLLNSNTMKSIWAYYLPISDAIYYFFVDKITKTLIGEIESNQRFVDLFGWYGEMFISLWIIVLSYAILSSLDIRNQVRRKAIKVTPLGLWKNNFKLNKYLFR